MTPDNRHSGNGPRPHFEFHVGGLHVIVRPPLIHLATDPRDASRRRPGPPRTFNGRRAQHITIPVEPMSHGPHAGKLWVHATSHNGEHRTLAVVDPREVEAAFARFAETLREYGAKSMQHFPIEELRRGGFGVVLAGDLVPEMFALRERGRRTIARLDPERIERVASTLEVLDLDVLDQLREASHVSLTDGDGTNLILGYAPSGLGQSQAPGWYGLPIEHQAIQALVDDFIISLGQPFFDAVATIARELEVEVDLDAIAHGRAARAAAIQPIAP